MSFALTAIGAAVGATLLQRLPMIIDLLAGPDNMSEFTGVTRNEFLTLIEDELLGEPYMPNIMQATLSLVSGYFLSTVALAVDIPGIDVRGTLDRVNTMRDPKQSMLGLLKNIYGNAKPGTESLELGLPRHDISIELFNEETRGSYNHLGMEANDEIQRRQLDKINQDIDHNKRTFAANARKSNQDIQNANNRENREKLKYLTDIKTNRITATQREELHKMSMDANAERLKQMVDSGATKADIDAETLKQKIADSEFAKSRFDAEKVISDLRAQLLNLQIDEAKTDQGKFSFGKGVVDTLKETTNLAVGKVLDVTFERNGNSKVVPVTVNLAAVSTDSASITDIFTFNSDNNSMSERRFKADAGDIERGKQLYLLTDMRDEAIRKSIKDKSGFYENMLRRSKGNFWSGLFGLSPSLNNASAVIIASRDTMRNAGLVLGGDFDDYKIREKVFANTASMIFVIIDTKWETVTFYHRNVKTYTRLALRELARGQKGGNDDIEGILKAYSAGAAPAVR